MGLRLNARCSKIFWRFEETSFPISKGKALGTRLDLRLEKVLEMFLNLHDIQGKLL